MTKKEKSAESPESSAPEYLPATQPARRPPTLAVPMGTPLDQCNHNFNLTIHAEKAALVNAANPADWQASDGGRFRLLVTRWIVLPCEEQVDEHGEVREYTPTVFVGADGRTARLNSDWAPRRVRAMLALFGQDEWDAGIEMEFSVRDSRRKGMRYGTFRIV